MDYFGFTDVGKVRANNEDFFFSDAEHGIFMVADGMGGHNGGEVASHMAVDGLVAYFMDEMNESAELAQVICNGIRKVNREIFQKAQTEEPLNGMGTTLDVCALKEDKLITFHIGDSRVYRLRDGKIEQLTTDHSFVEILIKNGEITREEAKNHPNRNMITRAVGTDETVLIDVAEHEVHKGDRYLLCTDGLTTMVSDAEITRVLNSKASLKEQAERLISKANEKGGTDNITVLIIQI